MLDVVVPGEFNEPPDRVRRRQFGQVELLFGRADVGISSLEHGRKQVVLAAKIVIDEALVHARACGNPINASTR